MELCTHIQACPSAVANCMALAPNSRLKEGTAAPARAVKTITPNFSSGHIQKLGLWQLSETVVLGL